MQETTITSIGVDIAKTNFVADFSGTTATFAQTAKDRAQFLKRLPANPTVVCEATSGYEQPLVEALSTAQTSVSAPATNSLSKAKTKPTTPGTPTPLLLLARQAARRRALFKK